MESLFNYVAPPGPCGYLPDQVWQLQYELFGELTPAEYMERMKSGWRRFGSMVFRPRCPHCTSCRSLRVPVATFRPNRSQKRARLANEADVEVRVGRPSVTRAKLELYDRYHAYQTESKGWREHAPKDAAEYAASFVENPFPTEEWTYSVGKRLVAVGYVDVLPEGMSAIYFFYDPDERGRSLGTWNVLSQIDACRERGLPHLYLGYFVGGCRSLEYKANFAPNQVLGPDGAWHDFRP